MDDSSSESSEQSDVDSAGGKRPRQSNSRLLTTRKLFSLIAFTTASVALWNGKLGGAEWVYAVAVILAGHHAADLIKAYRGNP